MNNIGDLNETNIKIHLERESGEKYDCHIPFDKFQQMMFLCNALNEGWSIKKRKNSYIFTKNHEGKKEVFEETYLLDFMKKNMDFNKLLK